MNTLRQAQRNIQATVQPLMRLQHLVASLHSHDATNDLKEDATAGRAEVEAMYKRVRDIGEDLLDETLRLDDLSDLSVEERQARKDAIHQASTLLEYVDSMKAKIGAARERFSANTVSAQASRPPAVHAPTAADSGSQTDRAITREADVQTDETAQPLAVTTAVQTDASLNNVTVDAGDPSIILAAPPRWLWETMQLPVRLRSEERGDCHLIFASAPNLDSESVRMRLVDGDRGLQISGCCVPTAEKAALIQKEALRNFDDATGKPETAEAVSPSVQERLAVMGAIYSQLGQGSFGRFVETVSIPADVDLRRIRVFCEGGMLRVLLPKLLRYRNIAQPARLGRYPLSSAL